MIKVLYILTSCKKSGPIQQMYNIIKNLDSSKFQAKLVTLYEEDLNLSVLSDYKKIVKHKKISVGKIEMMFGSLKTLRDEISDFTPDVIHTLGVFPDYMIYRLGFKNHVFTSRNFVYDDYTDQYGKLLGNILARIHLKAIKNSIYVRVCSKSLQDLYHSKLNINIPFVRNGVDLEQFTMPSHNDKQKLRLKFGISNDKIVLVYGGAFIGRKNHEFLLKNIVNFRYNNIILLLPGDGELLNQMKHQYGKQDWIRFPGNILNMTDYLQASDYYISTSKSEGLPNGVLEAMATGLPVLLSNIEQHDEIMQVGNGFGYLYNKESGEDFLNKLEMLMSENREQMGITSEKYVREYFSAKKMSETYQDLYLDILK